MLLAAVAIVVRLVFDTKDSVTGPMADSGSALNDLYLGSTYSGPRQVAQPQKQIALVIDDDERNSLKHSTRLIPATPIPKAGEPG